MSKQGAVLQSYNNELVNCIETLVEKRNTLQQQIQEEEDEKTKLQNDIRQLSDRLADVNESLSRKILTRNEYDKTIAESEAAYAKILESSQSLLKVLKKDAVVLSDAGRRPPSKTPKGSRSPKRP